MSKIEVRLNPDVPPTGSDLAVVNAARRSFNSRSDWDYFTKGEVNGRGELLEYVKLKDKDKRLIEFLARGMTVDDFEDFASEVLLMGGSEDYQDLVDKLWQWRNTPTHDTPFNHCFISFEVKAPIFVARQLVKHEYLIMSEFSRRYITDNVEFYVPDVWRGAAKNKKQGSSGVVDGVWDLEVETGGVVYHEYDPTPHVVTTCTMNFMESQMQFYRQLVEYGVAPEQARMVLPQSTMTEWTWSGTLGAFAKMCQLRLHPEAQYEARLVAQEVYKCLKEYYPVSAPALVEGVK